MALSILDFLALAGAPIPKINYNTPDWSQWTKDAAGVLTDADEIDQTIIIICSTIPGSDPMRPEFGCDFLPALDMPLNRAAPLLIARLTRALATWEPRIKVVGTEVSATRQGVLTIILTWERATVKSQPRTVSFAL